MKTILLTLLVLSGPAAFADVISGYDVDGNYITGDALGDDEQCEYQDPDTDEDREEQARIEAFEMACEAAGYELLYLNDCSSLCSGKVSIKLF